MWLLKEFKGTIHKNVSQNGDSNKKWSSYLLRMEQLVLPALRWKGQAGFQNLKSVAEEREDHLFKDVGNL